MYGSGDMFLGWGGDVYLASDREMREGIIYKLIACPYM